MIKSDYTFRDLFISKYWYKIYFPALSDTKKGLSIRRWNVLLQSGLGMGRSGYQCLKNKIMPWK